jgi:hypothetical protein
MQGSSLASVRAAGRSDDCQSRGPAILMAGRAWHRCRERHIRARSDVSGLCLPAVLRSIHAGRRPAQCCMKGLWDRTPGALIAKATKDQCEETSRSITAPSGGPGNAPARGGNGSRDGSADTPGSIGDPWSGSAIPKGSHSILSRVGLPYLSQSIQVPSGVYEDGSSDGSGGATGGDGIDPAMDEDRSGMG